MSLTLPSSIPSLFTALTEEEFYVVKRDQRREVVSFDKILNRVKSVGEQHGVLHINYTILTMSVINQLCNGISTSRIDELLAEDCATKFTVHYDYQTLATGIIITNHHKNTLSTFSAATHVLHQHNMVTSVYASFVAQHASQLDAAICNERDFLIDYFGFKTLERAYLLSFNKHVIERPQYLFMRVSIALNTRVDPDNEWDESLVGNMDQILECYHLMSQKYFIHATPTLFNAGTRFSQLSSCYLVAMKADSISGIFETLGDCALISKYAGGIGLHVHNIRARGTRIAGTNGTSNGVVPMLRVFNNMSLYVDQGGGKRNGSVAIYLEPWHADIVHVLDMKKNHGDEQQRARDLFYALWIPDLFMKRMKTEGSGWSLFCPHECPGLSDVYGDEFEALYTSYEQQGKAKQVMDVRVLWRLILDSQMETGTPYLLYKDAVNRTSNQKHVDIIRSSNLCCEVTLVSNPKETAVCNLASIALPRFVCLNPDTHVAYIDYDLLARVVRLVVRNLDNVIDLNYYPTKEAKASNMRHRPIGVGVQGLADMFALLGVPFDSDAAREYNRLVFETMYYAALDQSCVLAQQRGAYSTFQGSPASQGILQFDMQHVPYSTTTSTTLLPLRYDWTALKQRIQQHGLRNSTLMALMPTASTSQILGFNECFEPFTSNLYTRKTLSGDFVVVNKYLMRELIELGLWTEELKNKIVQNKGSVQALMEIPPSVRDRYKVSWELSMKWIIDMAADRSPFICQSQSMNLFVAEPNYKKLTAMYLYTWEKGLKTGVYYLRRKPRAFAQQFTIAPSSSPSQRLLEDGESGTGSGSGSGSESDLDSNEEIQEIQEVQDDEEDDGICASCSA